MICEVAVCSNKPRSHAGPNGKRSASWWSRDVYHLARSGITTLCGRDRSEWLTIGFIDKLDGNCCVRCAAKSVLPKQACDAEGKR